MLNPEQINKLSANLSALEMERNKAINALSVIKSNKDEMLIQYDIMEYNEIKETATNLLNFFTNKIEVVLFKINKQYPMLRNEFKAYGVKNHYQIH